MRNILVIGVGKSASVLVQYFQDKAVAHDLHITLADVVLANAQELQNNHERTSAIFFDVFDKELRQKTIQHADIVVSMLPARFHIEVARDCIAYGKHMVTASYVSPEMEQLDAAAKKKGLVFMNEIGLDPGIDHMSAMQSIDNIRDMGGQLLLFESFTGGLVSPESDTNLWNYKFTWNPRNVVLAGQGGTAKFIQEGSYRYIPYHKLFRRTEFLKIDGYGVFEAYANRDSLKYRSVYGLDTIKTLYRGTIRRVGFSKAWDMFVQLGMTADDYVIENSETLSYRDFINAFLPYSPTNSVALKLRHYLKIDHDDIMWDKLVALDLFNPDKKIGIPNATPAQMLQKILEDQWTLEKDGKDMIVMYHKFGYELYDKKQQIDTTMVILGENQKHTAMAKTVGLPVAMATLRILNGEFATPGVQIPIKKEIYAPILKELEEYGIIFNEKYCEYMGYNLEVAKG